MKAGVARPKHYSIPIGATTYVTLKTSAKLWQTSDFVWEFCAQHPLVPTDEYAINHKWNGEYFTIFISGPPRLRTQINIVCLTVKPVSSPKTLPQ